MAAHIEHHPGRLAQLLFPGCSAESLVSEWSSFAETYDDTADFLTRIPGIVHTIFGGQKAGRLSRAQKKWLEGLAAETLGANANWYARTGRFSDAAAVIWLSRLCYNEEEFWAGVDCCFCGLTGYVLAQPRRPEVAAVVRDALRDVVVHQYSWQSFLEGMITYLAANKVAGEPASFAEVVRDKLSQTSDLEETRSLMEYWWDFKEGAFCEFGRESIASHFDLARPGRAMPVPTEEYACIRGRLDESFCLMQQYLAEGSNRTGQAGRRHGQGK